MNTAVIQARTAVFMDPGLRRDDEEVSEQVSGCLNTNFRYTLKTVNHRLFSALSKA